LLVDWYRTSPLSDAVAASVVAVELQEKLLARERELDSREGAIALWDDGLAAFKHALGKAHTECDAGRVHARGCPAVLTCTDVCL
jgi:hypothetical protein